MTVGLGVLAVVVLMGVGYGALHSRSGTVTESRREAPAPPKLPEAAQPEAAPPQAARPQPPRELYVASPWAKLHSKPEPDPYETPWDIALGTRVDVDMAASRDGFIFVSQPGPKGTGEPRTGYLRESELRAQPFSFEEAWNEALKALSTLRVESASRYLELASRLDPSRIEPVEIRMAIQEERLTSAFDLETLAEKLGPRQGPADANEMKVGDVWYAYPDYIAENILDGLRATPELNAPSPEPLEKGTPLRILELGKEWLRVARVDDGDLHELGVETGAAQVDAGAPDTTPDATDGGDTAVATQGQEPPAEPAPHLPAPELAQTDTGGPRVPTGYLRSSALKPWSNEREQLERHLKLHMQAGDSRQAVRLMLGAVGLEPERSSERARAEEALLAFAIEAQQYKIAARAAVRLRRFDDTALELTYVFGCRGDRTQAELLKVSEIDQAKPKQGPKNACLLYDRSHEPCVFCAGAEDYEGETGLDFGPDRAKEAKRLRQEERLWERLSEAFPDGPFLRVRYAETPASARNGLTLYVHSQNYLMRWVCQDGGYWPIRRTGDKREPAQVTWPRSGEALLWLKPPHEVNALSTVRFQEDPSDDRNYPSAFGREFETEVLGRLYVNNHQEVTKALETRYGMMPYTFAPKNDNCPEEPDLRSAAE